MARPLRKYNVRVCVEIDLLKPRPNRIWLGMGAGGKWNKIIYERVPKFCSHCMLRGHDNESCRHLLQPNGKNKKNLKRVQKAFHKDPYTIGQAPNTSSSPKLQLKQFSPKKRCLPSFSLKLKLSLLAQVASQVVEI